MNLIVRRLTSEEIKSQLIFLQEVGKELLSYEFDILNPLNSLRPLGMALLEGYDLYLLLLVSQSSGKLSDLFDGPAEKGPNIDNWLKYIRDLCSASEYCIRWRPSSNRMKNECKRRIKEIPEISIGEEIWSNIITPYIRQLKEKIALIEISRLLDDMLEALLSIALLLKNISIEDLSEEIWDEIHRHIMHIRDHYDYAEEFVIDVLRLPIEGNK